MDTVPYNSHIYIHRQPEQVSTLAATKPDQIKWSLRRFNMSTKMPKFCRGKAVVVQVYEETPSTKMSKSKLNMNRQNNHRNQQNVDVHHHHHHYVHHCVKQEVTVHREESAHLHDDESLPKSSFSDRKPIPASNNRLQQQQPPRKDIVAAPKKLKQSKNSTPARPGNFFLQNFCASLTSVQIKKQSQNSRPSSAMTKFQVVMNSMKKQKKRGSKPKLLSALGKSK